MKKKSAIVKLQLILSNNELNRLKISETSNGDIRITADVHGMKCIQAKRFINNIINVIQMVFTLIIIHGYNHGTAIKDMLATDFANAHIKANYLDPHNQGVTHLVIA